MNLITSPCLLCTRRQVVVLGTEADGMYSFVLWPKITGVVLGNLFDLQQILKVQVEPEVLFCGCQNKYIYTLPHTHTYINTVYMYSSCSFVRRNWVRSAILSHWKMIPADTLHLETLRWVLKILTGGFEKDLEASEFLFFHIIYTVCIVFFSIIPQL